MGGDEDERALVRQIGGEAPVATGVPGFTSAVECRAHLHGVGCGEGRECVLRVRGLPGRVVEPGLLGGYGALDLLALVKLKAGDEGAAGGNGPAGPGEHPGSAARAAAGTLFLFILFGGFDPKPAALAGGEDGLGGVAICAIGSVTTIGAISAVKAAWEVDAICVIRAVDNRAVYNGDGDWLRGKDGLGFFGDLAHEPLAGLRRGSD